MSSFASKITKKFSTIFLFRERKKSFEKKITRELTTMKRCRKVVVLHSFVACVVSALVFARPARGFYLPGVAPQGTPRCCFCAKASRATWFLECLSLRVIESEFSFVEKDARCLTSFFSLSLSFSLRLRARRCRVHESEQADVHEDATALRVLHHAVLQTESDRLFG